MRVFVDEALVEEGRFPILTDNQEIIGDAVGSHVE